MEVSFLMKQTIKTSRAAGYLEKMFRSLNDHYFNNELEEPIITINLHHAHTVMLPFLKHGIKAMAISATNLISTRARLTARSRT